MRHAKARRSNEIPDFIGNLGLAEERKIRAAAKTEGSFRRAYSEGRMRGVII